ncbi:MAG: O-antigen ligase family protein [Ktedonobacteraceae bacterium]
MSFTQTFYTTGRMAALRLKTANRHILRALLSLASAALLLRVGGMLNQIIVSASFGAGASMDAYFVAAAFPLLLVQLISSAIEAAVIPVYSQLRMRANREETSRLFSTLLNCLVLGALPLSLLLFVLRQPLVLFTAPGLDPEQIGQAAELTPLLYLVMPVSLLLGLLECILNTEGQFGWPAYAGLLVPLTTALLTWLGGRTYGVFVLCAGALFGTILQLAVVIVRARLARLHYQFVLDWQNTHFKVILHAAWPVLLGAFISQGSPLVDQIFASILPGGSISALSYALKLVSIFSGVLFVSMGRAMLPYLARQAGLGDPTYRAFKGTLRLYLWCIGLCTLVLSLGMLLIATQLVQVFFQRGAFSAAAAQNTSMTLRGFLIGLTPMAVSFLLVRAFSALGETRIPMRVAFVSVSANALFDALFAHFWQSQGIALATSLVYLVSSVLLLALLSRRIGNLQLWQIPDEFQVFFARFRRTGKRKSGGIARARFDFFLVGGSWRQSLFGTGVTLLVLAGGAVASARNALLTLRVTFGMLIVLCLLRYPYVLLLALASINIGIGSSLALFNGNNLDLVLIVPLLLWLGFLPWRKMARRVPGLFWQSLYLAWVLIGIKLSPLDTRAFLTLWLTMLAYPAVSALAVALLTTQRRLLGLIDTLLVTALLAALYGLYGFLTHQHGEVDPGTHVFRITSLFTQATTFAFYLSLMIPLALYRCLFSQGIARFLSGLVMLCLLVALLLTFTRSAYVSVFVEVLLMTLCVPIRRVRIGVVGGLGVLCGLAILLGLNGQLPFLARFFNGDVGTLNGRIYLWQALLSRFQVTQWFGNGLQAADSVLGYLRVGSHGQGVVGSAPHNLYLGTLYDHGVIGLCLLMAIFLSLGGALLRGMRRSSGEQHMLYAAGLAVLANLLLQSFVSRDIWIQQVGIPFWIIAALPFALCWSQFETSAEIHTKPVSEAFAPAEVYSARAEKASSVEQDAVSVPRIPLYLFE